MPPPGLVLPGETMLLVLWPTVACVIQGEREPLSKPPFCMTGLAVLHAAVGEVAAVDTVDEVADESEDCADVATSATGEVS